MIFLFLICLTLIYRNTQKIIFFSCRRRWCVDFIAIKAHVMSCFKSLNSTIFWHQLLNTTLLWVEIFFCNCWFINKYLKIHKKIFNFNFVFASTSLSFSLAAVLEENEIKRLKGIFPEAKKRVLSKVERVMKFDTYQGRETRCSKKNI